MRFRINATEFFITVIIGLCICCANIYAVANNTTYQYAIELWNYGGAFLHVLYPLIFTIPFCWVTFHEKNGAYWKSLFNRTSLNKYLRKRVAAVILMSGLAMLLVSLGSLLFAYWIAPTHASSYSTTISASFYGSYQLANPVTYALILSCWRTILAALFSVFGVGITLINKNIFVAMTGAFVYSIAENFITAVLQIPAFSICTSFYPNRLSASAITFPRLLIGPVTILLAILSIYIYYHQKTRKTLMD